MGNTESNVTSGVKKQADTSSIILYKLVDLKGGGLLVELMKRAAQSKQYAELDHAIKTKVEPFLYNKGKGKLIPIGQLVLMRNVERPRHKMLPIARNMEEPFDTDKNYLNIPEPKDGDAVDMTKYRDVCWDLKERGAVGETILHLCLLNATSLHADLAKRLLRFYPKLINDIYMGDEYYGENVLHIAIVNEDPAMVKFLLDSGVNFQERCVGNFMCPEDQKASRTDSLDHEWVNLSPITNYEGYVYWGEYPLSFAACLGQEECYRLMLARGANPNSQDTNGNTILHLLVIYEKKSTFDTAYETGAELNIKNIQNLTPLTLAAKLARIEMFFHILNIEREIYWKIGSITCAAYPLSQIDTIDIETGKISKNSALNLVVFGDKDEHLELMDGVLIDLLNAKWNAFVKFRFYRQFFLFLFYFLISLVCFTLRPGPPSRVIATNSTNKPNITTPSSTLYFNATTPLPKINSDLIQKHNSTSFLGLNPLCRNDSHTLKCILYADPTSPTLGNKNKSHSGLTKSKSQVEGSSIKNTSSFRNNTLNFSLQYALSILNISIESKNKSIDILFERQYKETNKPISLLHQTENKSFIYTNHDRAGATKNETINSKIITSNESANTLPVVNITRIVLPTIPMKVELGLIATLKNWWNDVAGDCRLLQASKTQDIVRLCAELALELGAILYIVAALREARFLGLNMFIENLMTAPSRVMFLISCLLMLIIPFLRFSCYDQIEDIVAVVIMLSTAPYFLFFCRGFKTVGPFVVMIYRMVMGDLLRFVSIYLVFVMGFSQAFYIIFLSFDNPLTPDGVDDSVSNPLPNPLEAVMAMFFMSLTNFGDYYSAFERTDHEIGAKLLFVVYMAIVAILLVNMLIAMMGNTYQKIAETRNEWQRQWARIVLIVERGISPSERLCKLMWYSQPMSDGRRALVLRLNQSEEDKEEMKRILEMKRTHARIVQKRQAGMKLLTDTPSPKRLVDLPPSPKRIIT